MAKILNLVMRKIIQMFTLAIVGIALVSSCTIEKRLHTQGMSVSWNSNWKKQTAKLEKEKTNTPILAQTEVKTNNTQLDQAILNEPIIEKEVNVSTELTEVQTQENSNDVATTSNALPATKTTKTIAAHKNQVVKAHAAAVPKAVAKKQAKSSSEFVNGSGGGKASGGLLVLYIILCLFPFINLIPVYLTDGSVTLNFWVTLILDILGALPGIIFALLVVLGVVSL